MNHSNLLDRRVVNKTVYRGKGRPRAKDYIRVKEAKDNRLNVPECWRQGQFIFNFLEWLHVAKAIPCNQSYRLADTFHLSDEDYLKHLKEYQQQLGVKDD